MSGGKQTAAATVPQRKRNGARDNSTRTYILTVAFYVGVLILWELITSKWRLIPAYMLPAPSEIVQELIRSRSRLWMHTVVTLQEILLGFGLGVLIGVSAAIGVVYSKFLERVIYPLALFINTMPKLALAPLFLLWFGFGLAPKVAITTLVCVFPILINTVVGLKNVDKKMLDLMEMFAASGTQVFLKVRFPHALPYVFAGLEIGVSLATVGAIIGEWVGADSGLGYLVIFANNQMNTKLLFAAMLVIGLVGLTLFMAVKLLHYVIRPAPTKVDVQRA